MNGNYSVKLITNLHICPIKQPHKFNIHWVNIMFGNNSRTNENDRNNYRTINALNFDRPSKWINAWLELRLFERICRPFR